MKARNAYTCQRCDKTSEEAQIQTAHIVSRKYSWTRTLEENAYCLCAGCHRYFTEWPLEFYKFVSDTIGIEAYESLREKAEQGIGKVFKWEDEVNRLKEIAKEIGA